MAVDLRATLATVVTGLEAAGANASADPATLELPGVLVQFVRMGQATLTGRRVELQLLLVVPDTDGGLDAAEALSDLLETVESYADADGPIEATGVLLPSNPTKPMPGLRFPLNTYTEG